MTGSSARLDWDDDWVRECLKSEPAGRLVEDVTWVALRSVKMASPVETGALSRSWRARVVQVDGRPVGVISTRSPYWHIPQYGSAKVAPKRYIDRGMSRVGLRYDPSPKDSYGLLD